VQQPSSEPPDAKTLFLMGRSRPNKHYYFGRLVFWCTDQKMLRRAPPIGMPFYRQNIRPIARILSLRDENEPQCFHASMLRETPHEMSKRRSLVAALSQEMHAHSPVRVKSASA
jgi:hypothetical protein